METLKTKACARQNKVCQKSEVVASTILSLDHNPEQEEMTMKRALVFLAVLMGLGLVSSVAVAQDDDQKTKFYDFDDMLIDGEFKKPEGFVYGAVEKARFDRLLSLKKSFLPKIEETAKSDALKK